MWIAIDRPGYSHARRNDGQNITPHVGGLDVLHRSPTAKWLAAFAAGACGSSWHFYGAVTLGHDTDQYAAMHHIPAMYEYDVPNVTDGGLMSYGPDVKECMVSAAELAARILDGARPADLPFEEPTRYKLVVNLKTAKTTGITLPENFLALADEVIE